MTALVLWDGGDRAAWVDPGGTFQEGDLDHAARAFAGVPVRVALMHPALTVHAAVLPRLPAKRLARALAHALEDELPDDPDALTFTAGPRERSGAQLVAVAATAQCTAWTDALARAGLRAGALVPAAALVEPGAALLWCGLAAVRTPAGAWCLEEATARALPGPALPALWQDADAARLGALAAPAHAARAPDLCATPAGSAGLRAWRPALALTGLALIIGVAGAGAELSRLGQQRAALAAHLAARFAQLLPDTPLGADPLAQIESALRRAAVPIDSPLPALARAGPVLEERTLRALRYADQRLTVELELPDLGTLDAVREELLRAGIEARVVSATAQDGRVPATLELEVPR